MKTRGNLQKKAIMLANMPDVAPIELAEAIWLAEAQRPGCLAEIVEGTKLGRRKAYYLLRFWDRFRDLGVAKKDLAAIGWTKLAVIASRAETGAELASLELAKTMTVAQLHEALDNGEVTTSQSRSVLLRLNSRQYALFSRVLVQFGATVSNNGKGLAGQEQAIIRALRVAFQSS